MEIKTGKTPGTILIDCSECGHDFEMEDFRGSDTEEIWTTALNKCRWCPDCRERIIEEEKAETARKMEAQRRRNFYSNLRANLGEAGIPPGYIFDRKTQEIFVSPPVRYAAEWLWQNRERNVVLSGVTGSGKSTSACFVALKMMEELQSKVRYYTMGEVLSLWRAARRSEDNDADLRFLRTLFRDHDLVIVDEVVGKARISESGQELLFDLIEAVNNGNCQSRIWLLGNFYSGSIEAIFADPEPIRRRLQENFSCVRLDPELGRCVNLKVWEK